MINYKLSYKNPNTHYLEIEMSFNCDSKEKVEIKLPAWRPGRYELGNFAKNVKNFSITNEKEQSVKFKKTDKDTWEIEVQNSSRIFINYQYYSAELNAGSTYLDESQLYVNPINCCLYLPSLMNQEHTIELNIPESYQVASSLPKTNNYLKAKSYDELADSPFIASANLKSIFYDLKGVRFYLHFNGECHPDFEIIIKDFIGFCEECINFFGEIHLNEYHFLCQILPYPFYHGVEHLSNTVIAIGPGYHLMNPKIYNELLGVSCHELFHTWNIKAIRPKEMLPYDYSKENYARTGFVYEGFTTYYGDKLLFSSGVFKEETYFQTLEERITKHFHNFGRFNYSVAESSFDTWLDGYVPGAPYRKTSIYDEGCLIAFMLDVIILKETQNKNSLQDVLKILYLDFFKNGKGYSENDIQMIIERIVGNDVSKFFNSYVSGKEDYEPILNACLDYLGLSLKKSANNKHAENFLGMKTNINNGTFVVSAVYPESPAWKSGIFNGDEIVGVNKFALKNNLEEWLGHFLNSDENIELQIIKNGVFKNIHIEYNKHENYYPNFKIVRINDKIEMEKNSNFTTWLKVK